ncbi:hypothetical protein [uncultured Tateyamaria sp.]|uniref:hypothetical protein n=1 Tax=uncultured Tateyamaria sp. TaxID=455651 RepID=UPI002618DA7C|nr:hypothetical protein [uncultured Tateyamaria sp.]
MRRSATILLHWLSFVLLILLVAAGPLPGLTWAFGLSGLAMCAVALVRGLMNGPGPKLEGTLRLAHPWMSRGMYAGLGLVAAVSLWSQIAETAPVSKLGAIYFYLMSASALHAIFHLWRHTSLGDGALRRITPNVVHGIL